jgi:hypothetical protein
MSNREDLAGERNTTPGNIQNSRYNDSGSNYSFGDSKRQTKKTHLKLCEEDKAV